MTLKDTSVDGEFLGFLLEEMCRIFLPRTQLLALECLSQSCHVDICKDSDSCSSSLWKALESTAARILSELRLFSAPDGTTECLSQATFDTVDRLSQLMISLCGIEEESKLKYFIAKATELASHTKSDRLKSTLDKVIEEIERHRQSFWV